MLLIRSCFRVQIYKHILIPPNKNKEFFDFALKLFVFAYYIYIRCKACTQTNTRRPLQALEMGTPSPRSEQLHNMGNHTRTTSGLTPTDTPPTTPQATFTPMSNHTQNDTQGALGAQPDTLARQGVRQNIPTSFALPSPYQRVAVRRLPFLVRGLLKITICSNR